MTFKEQETDMETNESFIPYVGKIIDIRQETPDVKTQLHNHIF